MEKDNWIVQISVSIMGPFIAKSQTERTNLCMDLWNWTNWPEMTRWLAKLFSVYFVVLAIIKHYRHLIKEHQFVFAAINAVFEALIFE